jgi:S-DNA-T family DNA segregation ATPase FtsK/SpoIIIE
MSNAEFLQTKIKMIEGILKEIKKINFSSITCPFDKPIGTGTYALAVKVVMDHRSASASLLQRRLGIGYKKAASQLEDMEANGIVGPTQGKKPLNILVS